MEHIEKYIYLELYERFVREWGNSFAQAMNRAVLLYLTRIRDMGKIRDFEFQNGQNPNHLFDFIKIQKNDGEWLDMSRVVIVKTRPHTPRADRDLEPRDMIMHCWHSNYAFYVDREFHKYLQGVNDREQESATTTWSWDPNHPFHQHYLLEAKMRESKYSAEKITEPKSKLSALEELLAEAEEDLS